MIVWLASYPRSGNTLLRLILRNCCDLTSYSIHTGRSLRIGKGGLSEDPEWAGQAFSAEHMYQVARSSKRKYFFKTHDAPRDDAPAIFIERDGRAACVSYLHFVREFEDPDATLPDVILGLVNSSSWSEHHDSWRPTERPNTLLIRFEEMIQQPDLIGERAAAFLGVKFLRSFGENFESLHEIHPKFFRSGSNEANIAEMKGEDESLFWVMHGQLMMERGYVDRVPAAKMDTRELLIRQRERWAEILSRRHSRHLALNPVDQRLRVSGDHADIDALRREIQVLKADHQARGEVIERLVAENSALKGSG